jgi:hypothetical protein
MQPQTVWCTPQGNIELVPKKEVLDFKPAPRPEQVDDKRPKQIEDRKHRRGGCADSASSRESVRMRFLGTTGELKLACGESCIAVARGWARTGDRGLVLDVNRTILRRD